MSGVVSHAYARGPRWGMAGERSKEGGIFNDYFSQGERSWEWCRSNSGSGGGCEIEEDEEPRQ
jgi:hypothetical protein